MNWEPAKLATEMAEQRRSDPDIGYSHNHLPAANPAGLCRQLRRLWPFSKRSPMLTHGAITLPPAIAGSLTLNTREKLEIARHLDVLKVWLYFITYSQTKSALVRH